MKIETILSALEINCWNRHGKGGIELERGLRQYRAFRDRIIRMDERQKMEIARLRNEIGTWEEMNEMIWGGVIDET